MLKNADLVIASAAGNNALNKTTESQVALIEAQNEKNGYTCSNWRDLEVSN